MEQRIKAKATWTDLTLTRDSVIKLRELCDQVKRNGGSKSRIGKNVLFSGPDRAGRLKAAEVVSNELQADIYRIDLAGLLSKYIGEAEKNLRRIFDAAESTNCVLFFDEADALFGKRSEVKDAHDRYVNQEVAYLLQRMEAYEGMVILATNLSSGGGEVLDESLLRRFRYTVEFPLPKKAG